MPIFVVAYALPEGEWTAPAGLSSGDRRPVVFSGGVTGWADWYPTCAPESSDYLQLGPLVVTGVDRIHPAIGCDHDEPYRRSTWLIIRLPDRAVLVTFPDREIQTLTWTPR